MREFEPMVCQHGGDTLEGFVAVPAGTGPHPAVLVMHSALGLGQPVERAARRLAALGYLAVATDMYGTGADVSSPEAAGQHFARLGANPQHLRARTVAWFQAVAARPDVDAARIAAIGYCFGGTCVLELARSGADLKAAVSFHGILTTHAPAQPGAIAGEVAAYCGARDPYAPLEHIEALRRELNDVGAHHQIMIFGEAEHAFTDPDEAGASSGHGGIGYNRIADEVSWAGATALLGAVLRG